MSFERALSKLSQEKRRVVRQRLADFSAESAIHQQMVHNLYAESRLAEPEWTPLVDLLLNPTTNIQESEKEIRKFCRERILKGQISSPPSNLDYGRVITLEQLCEVLVKAHFFNDTDDAKATLELMIDLNPEDLPPQWAEIPLGRYLMWSTFDPENGKPFGDAPPEAEYLLCTLGLPPPEESPLLLLEFRLQGDVQPMVPTFCDAYAAEFWSRYFRPAPPGAPYGRTMATEDCPDQKGRPEVVHSVIDARNLVAPLRYAK